MGYFNFNGKIFKEGAAIIGADNRGLRYGDGIFETMKLLNGSLQFCDEHFARLWKGMMVLGFDIPKHFEPEKITEEIVQLAQKNNHTKAARIRLQLIRGDGGLYDAVNNFPNYIIQSWELPTVNGEWNNNGLVVGVYEAAKKSIDVLSNLKHNNYLPYAMAALYAKKEKWNDALLLNSYGKICDSTIANIFLIKNKEVITPALTEGCVAGIMRQQIINTLKEHGFTIIETSISIDDVLNADEMFLSNSIYNIRWVQQIGDKKFSHQTAQKIYLLLISTIG